MTLVVVALSDSFSELWPQLAEDLGTSARVLLAEEARHLPADAVAVIVAAGGEEREAREWLDQSDVPADVPVLAVGADPSRRIAVQLVAHGAADYFALPEDVEILRNAVRAAAERRGQSRARAESRAGGGPKGSFEEIIGSSGVLRAVLDRAARLQPHADAVALIAGETGTGKELLARAIHAGSPRHASPFVPVNCSALPYQLVESELFGHERGAFTDAHAAKPGLFEVAHGGTLFLDEIGTIPVDLQAKLLRALDDREIRRVGGTKSRRVDVRIIAATNEDLEAAVKRGAFREDLFYRLSVVTLTLPPLRARGEDVVLIAERLVSRLAKQHGFAAPSVSEEAKRALLSHHWPGNVRELKNAVERALLLSPPGTLMLEELVPRSGESRQFGGVLPFPAMLDDIQSAAAQAMVDVCEGNRSEAARRLGVSRRRLRRLLGLQAGTD